MNVKPHTHQVKITRYWPTSNSGCWVVEYGDTSIKVHQGPFFERRLERGIRRAIRRHDVGSVRAGQSAERVARIKATAIAAVPIDSNGGWGSQKSGQFDAEL